MAATPDRHATEPGGDDLPLMFRWDARKQFPEGLDGPTIGGDELHHLKGTIGYARNGGDVVVLPGPEPWQAIVIVTPGDWMN